VRRGGSRLRDVLVLLIVVAVAVPSIVFVTRALTHNRELAPAASPAAGLAIAGGPVASPTGPPQSCASCWKDKGAPAPAVPGKTEMVDGVQVVRVGLVDGYYRPNRFVVRAGVPVVAVFTGWAQDCLGQPEFPEVGVKGDLSSGRAIIELGKLEPGTYTFTCSMGVNEGRITAR
jgi:hypothetical protein